MIEEQELFEDQEEAYESELPFAEEERFFKPEPPDIEQLMAWEWEGGCEATDGCWVEPDGTCPHGRPSWLKALGMI